MEHANQRSSRVLVVTVAAGLILAAAVAVIPFASSARAIAPSLRQPQAASPLLMRTVDQELVITLRRSGSRSSMTAV